MVGAMTSATVGVRDLAAALRLFRDEMELVIEARAALSEPLARAWHLPPGTRGEWAELSCRGYPVGRVRLLQLDPPAQQKVRVDFGPNAVDSPLDIGPKALDFYVAAPIQDAIARYARAGFPARSAPVYHQIGQTISEELLFSGPDDVPILLMIGHRHSAASMRAGSPHGPFSEVPTVSVICADLDASRAFYGGLLGLVPVNDAETPEQYRDLVCDLTGVPRGHRVHFLLYAAPGEASGKVLLVHFHGAPARRLEGRMRPQHLGFVMLTHHTRRLDALHRALAAAGHAVLTPPVTVHDGDRTRRLMLVRGPNEELFEFVEAD